MSPVVSSVPPTTDHVAGGTDRAGEVLAELARRGVPDASASALSRSLYSSDASIYRLEPLVVVPPAAHATSSPPSSTW